MGRFHAGSAAACVADGFDAGPAAALILVARRVLECIAEK
jgi:hypothetical protein